MTDAYCKNCGSKLNEDSNICLACSYHSDNDSNEKNEELEIVASGNNLKHGILNSVLFLVLAWAAFNYYTIMFAMVFLGERVNNSIINTMFGGAGYDDAFIIRTLIIIPACYLLGIIIISKLFKKMAASKLFVKITFLTCLILIVVFAFQMVHTAVVYFISDKAIEMVYPHNIDSVPDEVMFEISQSVLRWKLFVLLANILAVGGFVALMLKRYFKKQSLTLKKGVKTLLTQPKHFDFNSMFKQLS